MIEAIFTIGGYGHSQMSFFEQLRSNEVDAFVDIRQRRGMRGKTYSFLNSIMLQEELKRRGIPYIHLAKLAPTKDIRDTQKNFDKADGIQKQQRLELSCAFKDGYQSKILGSVAPDDVIRSIQPHRRPCFFCVEGPAVACHRSLVAEWLHDHTSAPVKHIGRP